jgi:hypothetical protein
MPLTTVLVLAGIITAFLTFGVALAWAERQTRYVSRDRPPVRVPDVEAEDHWKKAA